MGQAWVQRFGVLTETSGDNDPRIARGPDGSVVVAGFTTDGMTSADILVIKYSSTGVAQWTNTYNGPANLFDGARDVAVGADGKVFVAGSSVAATGRSDFIVLAYSPTGVALWTNRYNISFESSVAIAVVVDAVGNVIVSGNSGDDYATVKYSPTGVPVWTNRCNGRFTDTVKAMTADKDGSIIVTGVSSGALGNFATVKYSAGGTPMWTNFCDGNLGRDYPWAVIADGNGNVFVTGQSDEFTGNSDFLTVAYSAAGVALWTNRYDAASSNRADGAYAMAIDPEGNVLVTGPSMNASTNFDFVTIKYALSGVPLWTNRFAVGTGIDETAMAISVNSNSEIFVSGTFNGNGGASNYVRVKYSASGVPLLTNFYGGPPQLTYVNSLVVDPNGDIVVGGYGYDWVTLKFSDTDGSWTNVYGGYGKGNSVAVGVKTDGAGKVFVSGQSTLTGNNYDYMTVAYTTGGVALWTNTYNGPASGADIVNALVVDSNGDVIVAGTSWGEGGGYDFATIKYSNAGTPLWTNRYSLAGPTNLNDQVVGMAVDGGGNIFVTGSSTISNIFKEFATVAYSATGLPLWTNRFSGGVPLDTPVAIGVDPNGNVLVTGNYLRTNTSGGAYLGIATIKYSNAGVAVWTNRYFGSATANDTASCLTLDTEGNVIIGGTYSSFLTLKYSAAGTPVWTNFYRFNTSDSSATAVVTDTNGNVFVTGKTYTFGGYEYATIKYLATGQPAWTNRYAYGSLSDSDVPVAVAVDALGNVFVSGYSGDFATLKYSNSGTLLWLSRYDGPAKGDDKPTGQGSLCVAADGSVYVTGSSDGDPSGVTVYDFATVKLVSSPVLTHQPASRTNLLGTTASFDVTAYGGEPYAYQWRRGGTNLLNGANVSGANTSTLTLASVQSKDAGNITVVVTNVGGAVTSSVAALTVILPPAIMMRGTTVSNGVLTTMFTNLPGINFTILMATNLDLPLSNWAVVGSAIEGPPGQFKFIDQQLPGEGERYYRIRYP